jgi:hypothetical protein
VHWRPAAQATRYEVIVHTSDGAHLVELTQGNQHTLIIHDSVPITAGTATVIALVPGAMAGPSSKTLAFSFRHRRH